MHKDEELTIRLLLSSPNEIQVRLGLIRLCETYQRGAVLLRTQDIREKLHSFIFQKYQPERARWALKILAEMRNPEDYDILLARHKTSPDSEHFFVENRAWTIVALHAVATEDQIATAYENGTLDRDEIALIAYELAEIPGLLPRDLPRINIQRANDVLLKCACVCMATGRNKRAIFDPKFKQDEQLIALNDHHVAEVAQYSIYAMWRSPRLTFDRLGFTLDTLQVRPPDVRRWAYRLLCKQQKSVSKNRDLFQQIIKSESDGAALEGLALGLRDLWYDGIEVSMVDWFNSEQDERVKFAILEHMAKQSDHSPSYADMVIETYRKDSLSVLKARIKEAAATTALYSKLERFDEMLDNQTQLFVAGDLFVTKNTQKFTGGQVNIGVNTIGGNSTGNKVDQSIQLSQDLSDIAAKMQAAADNGDRSTQSKEVSESLRELRNAPTSNKLQSALEATKNWIGAGALTAEIMTYAKEFIELASALLPKT